MNITVYSRSKSGDWSLLRRFERVPTELSDDAAIMRFGIGGHLRVERTDARGAMHVVQQGR